MECYDTKYCCQLILDMESCVSSEGCSNISRKGQKALIKQESRYRKISLVIFIPEIFIVFTQSQINAIPINHEIQEEDRFIYVLTVWTFNQSLTWDKHTLVYLYKSREINFYLHLNHKLQQVSEFLIKNEFNKELKKIMINRSTIEC